MYSSLQPRYTTHDPHYKTDRSRDVARRPRASGAVTKRNKEYNDLHAVFARTTPSPPNRRHAGGRDRGSSSEAGFARKVRRLVFTHLLVGVEGVDDEGEELVDISGESEGLRLRRLRCLRRRVCRRFRHIFC